MKISILMAIYAGEKPEYFEQALQSLADQTLRAAELVLVEDGPIGWELRVVIERYRIKLNIKSVKLKKNSGLAAALNTGLKHCCHELVARMDSDDISLPQRFEKQAAYFDHEQEIDVLGSFALDIDEKGKRGLLREKPVTHEAIVSGLWASSLIHPTVMLRKEALLASGGYNSSLQRRQDYEMWFRMAVRGLKFFNIPEPLLLYRFSRHTHRKQPVRLAWEQAMIGYTGSRSLNMAWWKQVACFLPFLRSFLPAEFQHLIYTAVHKSRLLKANHRR